MSYGNAQKPLNVFLKVYVDWAGKPTAELAERLRPLLHVPLDSVVMKFMKREFPADYESHIGVCRRRKLQLVTERLKAVSKKATRAEARRLLGSASAISAVDKPLYHAWQAWFQELWPEKPVELDLIWALERGRRVQPRNSSPIS
jgi:hypothetical protein